MHVTEGFLAQKHTDGRRCRHLRTAHADVPRRGVVGSQDRLRCPHYGPGGV